MSRSFPTITKLETFISQSQGSGGDYHNQKQGHWIIDTPISNPMSGYEDYRHSRTSWGIGVLGSLVVKVTASDGTEGIATGFGGPPACWLIEQHYARFVIGQDPRNTQIMWDQMFRASMFYGRKGLPLAAISVVDLAIWDLIGKIRNEPVYALIGGRTKVPMTEDRKSGGIPFYLTSPNAHIAKELGFWGGKVPLPYPPSDGPEGLRKNVEFLKDQRQKAGPGYPIMVDCYMSLNVPYAIQLAQKCIDENVDIHWWEECLHPDDFDGHRKLKTALPQLNWTTGEHEYSRYGFRKLIEERSIDIIQPDVMWLGGLTELLKVEAMASAYDIPIVPHGSGPYSYHAIMTFTNSRFCEYIANSADGKTLLPVFGDLFLDEPLPHNGRLDVEDKPGFGLTLNPACNLFPMAGVLNPQVERPLKEADK